MILRMELGARSYDIVVERGVLKKAGSLLNLDRKCLIVTGAMVPKQYADTVAARCLSVSAKRCWRMTFIGVTASRPWAAA